MNNNWCSCIKCQGFGWYWEPNGSTDQRYSCDCGAPDQRWCGKDFVDAARLANLAANLRLVGALCVSFELAESAATGRCTMPSQYEMHGAGLCNNLLPCANHDTGWRANTAGKPAPGWSES